MPSGRPRSAALWLQLFLLATTASIVVLLAQAYRTARSSEVVAERALADYANFAAWSYREHLLARIRAAVDELLGPVNHGEGLHDGPQVPDAREMGHTMTWDPSCECHRPRHGPSPSYYLAFALGSDTLAVGVNYATNRGEGWLADPPSGKIKPLRPTNAYSLEQSRWINAELSRVARRSPRSDWGYDFTIVRSDSTTHVFGSRSMPTTRGDTIVYAVEYPTPALNSLLATVLRSSDLLPSSLVAARTNRDVIDLEVTNSDGALLFRSSDAPPREFAASTALPASYGALQVRAQVRRELASLLLIGGVPRSRVPLVLAILALAIGLSIVAAIQLRREVRFVGERANFVANVSHELRTPLTQVRLVLDTLQLGRATEPASRDHALGVANREVLRLQHLVEGLLRFTRGPRRDQSLKRGDVAEEARTVAAEFCPIAEPRGVRVVVTGDESIEATLHAGALRQVMLNLLDNAVKYGQDNSDVTVELRAVRDNGGGVRLSVSDHGPGVPPAERKRIWRPYERGGAAQRRAAGGSGIGLTIVREIAREHGGRAWVEEGGDAGARFVVELHDATR